MVTAKPSYDLLRNPFEQESKHFSSLPVVETTLVGFPPETRRRNNNRNKNRQTNNRRQGLRNPFAEIMEMISPRQTKSRSRPLRDRPTPSKRLRQNAAKPVAIIPENIPPTAVKHTPQHPGPKAFSEITHANLPSIPVKTIEHSPLTQNSFKNEETNNHVGNSLRREQTMLNYKPEIIPVHQGNKVRPDKPIGIPLSFVPDRSHEQRVRSPNRRRNRKRRPVPPRQRRPMSPHSPSNNQIPPFALKEPQFIQGVAPNLPLYDNENMKPINPHDRHTTAVPVEDKTKSHFDVKYLDTDRADPSFDAHGPEQRPFGSNPEFGAFPQPNEPIVLQNLRRQPINSQVLQMPPRQSAYRPNSPNRRQQNGPGSIWAALRNFDFSFLNPFSSYENNERNDGSLIDRTQPEEDSSMWWPGGLAALGAGLSLFYFNFIWYPTPVVTARLQNIVSGSMPSNSLTEEAQRAIGDVTKVIRKNSSLFMNLNIN